MFSKADNSAAWAVGGALVMFFIGGLLTTGADDFLSKPFTRTEFRSRVRGLRFAE